MSCTDCERCSFDDACVARDKVAPIPSKLDDWMHANGWEWPRSPFNGYVRLCAKCQDDKRPLFEGNRTLWCLSCGSDHDVTPVGTPPEHCRSCSAGGEWWTRNQRFVVERTLEAMFAYQLAGSEEGARELLRSAELSEPGVACRTCGALACTKNHAEFM